MQVLPRINALMAGSAPFNDPSQGVENIHAWRSLLESAEQANAHYFDVANSSSDPYSTLLLMTVVPKLQSAVTNLWDPQTPEPMLKWLEHWQRNLPPSVEFLILDTLVFPKVPPPILFPFPSPHASHLCSLFFFLVCLPKRCLHRLLSSNVLSYCDT